MLLYTTVGTNDLLRAGRFYDAILPLIGYVRQKEAPGEIGYAADGDVRCRFWVVEPFNREPATFGNGVTIAFEAPNRASVDAFHAAALAHGGTDEGPPGPRPHYGPNWYSAYVRDPSGNKLAIVYDS